MVQNEFVCIQSKKTKPKQNNKCGKCYKLVICGKEYNQVICTISVTLLFEIISKQKVFFFFLKGTGHGL